MKILSFFAVRFGVAILIYHAIVPNLFDLDGSGEFDGGRITGPFLYCGIIGYYILWMSVLFSIAFRKLQFYLSILSVAMMLPISLTLSCDRCFYYVFPDPYFRWEDQVLISDWRVFLVIPLQICSVLISLQLKNIDRFDDSGAIGAEGSERGD
jgi:hypothetical protein